MCAGLDKFVLEEFKSLDSVKAVYGVYSEYDLISVVKHDTSKDVCPRRLLRFLRIKGCASRVRW